MGKPWRLILDRKCDGYYNMAVDEALLLHYADFTIPTLRVYGWSRPFVSLGYNQNPQEVLKLESEIPFVRRITGGAAILHHKELTYSLICSRKDLDLPGDVKISYKIICSFLKDFYRRLGLKAYFANDLCFFQRRTPEGLGRYKNFCFSNWQHFDILIGKKKIGGNAQRLRKNIIFQHGSIPQEIDAAYVDKSIRDSFGFQDKATSLDEETGRVSDFALLSSLLASSFKSTFGVDLGRDRLSPPEREKADFLLKEKYKTSAWNNRKLFENA